MEKAFGSKKWGELKMKVFMSINTINVVSM